MSPRSAPSTSAGRWSRTSKPARCGRSTLKPMAEAANRPATHRVTGPPTLKALCSTPSAGFLSTTPAVTVTSPAGASAPCSAATCPSPTLAFGTPSTRPGTRSWSCSRPAPTRSPWHASASPGCPRSQASASPAMAPTPTQQTRAPRLEDYGRGRGKLHRRPGHPHPPAGWSALARRLGRRRPGRQSPAAEKPARANAAHRAQRALKRAQDKPEAVHLGLRQEPELSYWRAHFCALVPLQLQTCTNVPVVVPEDCTSMHRLVLLAG